MAAEPREPPGRALRRIDPAWDAARTEHALAGLHRRRRARRRGAVALGMLSLAAAIGLVAWVGSSLDTTHASATLAERDAPSGDDRSLRLADGSVLVPEGEARVVVERVTEARVEVAVAEGAASFDVVPDPARRFEVRAGEVTVRVLGTSFRVERLEDGRTRVDVTRGHVEVVWATGRAELVAGQGGAFPRASEALAAAGDPSLDTREATRGQPEASLDTREASLDTREASLDTREASRELDAPGPDLAPPAPSAASSRRVRVEAAPRTSPATSPPEASWRELAEAARYDDAYLALDAAQGDTVRDATEDLLLAADVARLSGHPARALPWLEAVERDHASDPRAVVATFTRGRILTELGRAAEGARALEDVIAREPDGSLAEDALARAALAHRVAGDHARARTLAARYLAAHPDGRWAARLRPLAEDDEGPR